MKAIKELARWIEFAVLAVWFGIKVIICAPIYILIVVIGAFFPME